jgi:hypothetical protein
MPNIQLKQQDMQLFGDLHSAGRIETFACQVNQRENPITDLPASIAFLSFSFLSSSLFVGIPGCSLR